MKYFGSQLELEGITELTPEQLMTWGGGYGNPSTYNRTSTSKTTPARTSPSSYSTASRPTSVTKMQQIRTKANNGGTKSQKPQVPKKDPGASAGPGPKAKTTPTKTMAATTSKTKTNPYAVRSVPPPKTKNKPTSTAIAGGKARPNKTSPTSQAAAQDKKKDLSGSSPTSGGTKSPKPQKTGYTTGVKTKTKDFSPTLPETGSRKRPEELTPEQERLLIARENQRRRELNMPMQHTLPYTYEVRSVVHQIREFHLDSEASTWDPALHRCDNYVEEFFKEVVKIPIKDIWGSAETYTVEGHEAYLDAENALRSKPAVGKWNVVLATDPTKGASGHAAAIRVNRDGSVLVAAFGYMYDSPSRDRGQHVEVYSSLSEMKRSWQRGGLNWQDFDFWDPSVPIRGNNRP
ncbi:hypothetical protein [Spirochaeta lutea]|uniref:Uncharacterized protein n=1 Tax=Spirochaeta lutea TaxID=1480694 RepID=A0A098R2B8_9SPIO|nr:hypothetical protein [Spirochaeta lutea]KGE72812.1 hypothetical protein DC28_05390 [Spirochaeta lutea]